MLKMKELDNTKVSIDTLKASIKKFQGLLKTQKDVEKNIEEQARALNEKQVKAAQIITIGHHVKQKKIEEDLIFIRDTLLKKASN